MEEKEVQGAPVHKRRVRYSGTHPKRFEEKYKEQNPEKYADTVEKVIKKGSTPAGMHISICVNEILDFLDIRPGMQGLDATLGYGGHTTEMLKKLEGQGHMYGLDVDPIEIVKTKARLKERGFDEDILTVKQMNFADIDKLVPETGLFDFVLADLGVSSMQIDNPERGFTYKADGPLDLRLNPEKGISAAERLKQMDMEEIAGMFVENSDEPYAEEIAREIETVTEGNVTTITVKDETAMGEKVNTYTLTFKGVSAEIQLPVEIPALTYGDEVDGLGFISNNTKDALAYSFSKEGVLEVGEDGKVRAVGAGEVVVTASQPGSDDFTPAESEPMTLTVAKAPLNVSLADDAWTWRGIAVSTSNMDKGKCHYTFVYDGWKWNDAEKDASEVLSKLPTVSASAPKDAEAVGSERAAKLSGGAAENYDLKFAEDAKFKVVKNKVGVYVKYGSNTLSTAYDDEKYRTVNAAVGQEEYIFTTGYSDAVYDDEDVLAALATQPEVVCSVNKDAVVGDEFPVSVQLPEKVSFDNFELVSIVPDVAKLVMAESPGITVTVPETVTYGDEFTLVTNEHGITYNSTVLTSGVVSMTYKGVVTAKKAGKAELVVTTAPKTVDGVDYGATTTKVAFDIQKAALTIKANDVEVNLDGDLPETYELVYEGFVNKDKAETVFTDMPVATVNLPEPLTAGTYPIKVSVSEEPENYVVTTVDGTLTVKDGSSVAGVSSKNDKVAYANGNLYVPCGGRVEIYALTGALVGRYEGAVIPVALRTNTLYIVKTQKGAFRLWVK